MRFPVEGLGGKCDPEFVSKVGCSFPAEAQAEAASRFRREFWGTACRGLWAANYMWQHKTPIRGVKNKWYIQQLILMWGGGMILLVAHNIEPPINELRSG